MNDRDGVSSKLSRWTNARQHEYLRRVDGPQHFVPSEQTGVIINEQTHDKTTSFLARARYRVLFPAFANSTPTAFVATPLFSKIMRVTCAWIATLRFGLLRTCGVRYADSVDTRRPLELM